MVQALPVLDPLHAALGVRYGAYEFSPFPALCVFCFFLYKGIIKHCFHVIKIIKH